MRENAWCVFCWFETSTLSTNRCVWSFCFFDDWLMDWKQQKMESWCWNSKIFWDVNYWIRCYFWSSVTFHNCLAKIFNASILFFEFFNFEFCNLSCACVLITMRMKMRLFEMRLNILWQKLRISYALHVSRALLSQNYFHISM